MAKQTDDISFEKDDFILNYRPQIDFVEPDQEPYEIPEIEVKPTIDAVRQDANELLNGLHVANKLIDSLQERVDNRVNSLGGVTVKLDPNKDYATVAAIKRRFPNKEDPTVITYDDYKEVLNCIKKNSPTPPLITTTDIKDAAQDPYRTEFGGSDNQQGENRPEISSPMENIKPLDLDAFQKAGILAIFALMLPLIKVESQKDIALHLATVPHKPI